MSTYQLGQLLHARSTRTILSIVALWLVAYIMWAFLGPRDIALNAILATFSLASIESLAAVFGFRVSRITSLDERLRKAWRWISRALVVAALAEWLWFVYSAFHLTPIPWLTDVLYFLYYPFILIALFRFPFVSARRSERIIFWLDLTVIITATLMVFWAVNLPFFQDLYQQDPLVSIILVFPLADALLFAGVTALVQRDVEGVGHRSFLFLTSALGLHALAEGFYLYARVHWYEWAQPYIYILWILGAFCFLMAAVIQIYLEPAPREIYPSRTRSFLRLILPYLAVMAGWSTLLYITFTSGRLDIRLYGVLIGSLLLGALVLWRQYTLLVENFHLYADMQHLAITDSLTGLYNRHYFNQVLNRELLRAERYNSPLALLLADVDDFKLFNDTLGHLQGDQVLKVVSNTLNTQLRQVDLLARFGGDEFAVIMPGTDQIGAEIASTRIREVVARQSYADKQLGLSIGVAVFVPGMSPEQFVEQADRELYRSKLSKTAYNTQSHP